MTYQEPDPEDPHLLVGVELPADESASREMAETFADEFAQMGFDHDRLLRLFSSPEYRGAYAARQLLGEAEVARIVKESLRAYGSTTLRVEDRPGAPDDEEPEALRGQRRLRVL